METSSEDIKKSARGRPRSDTSPVMVRVTAGELSKIDAWIAANGPPYVSRPEAIRRLVEKGLGAD
ncbi:CopG family transcriptional regulator [Sphingomonas fennica]|uniref:CopG family transcriptional regulator n=1 Tax=Edaphosphingomonas fennica TaxID=114404 RepID=A0A2T4HVR7_9SPHN|nr:CopG family transcriptional regulator [Sphingomonas fennica]